MVLKREDLKKLTGGYQTWKKESVAKAQGEAQTVEEKGETLPESET